MADNPVITDESGDQVTQVDNRLWLFPKGSGSGHQILGAERVYRRVRDGEDWSLWLFKLAHYPGGSRRFISDNTCYDALLEALDGR